MGTCQSQVEEVSVKNEPRLGFLVSGPIRESSRGVRDWKQEQLRVSRGLNSSVRTVSSRETSAPTSTRSNSNY